MSSATNELFSKFSPFEKLLQLTSHSGRFPPNFFLANANDFSVFCYPLERNHRNTRRNPLTANYVRVEANITSSIKFRLSSGSGNREYVEFYERFLIQKKKNETVEKLWEIENSRLFFPS